MKYNTFLLCVSKQYDKLTQSSNYYKNREKVNIIDSKTKIYYSYFYYQSRLIEIFP